MQQAHMYYEFIKLNSNFASFAKTLSKLKKASIFVSFCLVLVISGVVAYLYVGPKGSGASDDLTERVENLESRLDELLVLSDGVWNINEQIITFKIAHIGMAYPVNISEIRVNNVLNSSSPGWEGACALAPGMVGEITLYGTKYFAEGFTDENCGSITVTTTRGNTFCLYALTFTFMKTEELKITSVTFTDLSTPVIACTNTGADTLTVTSVTIDDVQETSLTWGGQFDATAHSLDKGESGTITIALSSALTSGAKYTFAVLTSAGNKYTYTTTAP